MSASGFLARSRLIAAFAAVYLIWGSTFLALTLGLQSIPPLLLMGARSIGAGAILLAIEQTRRPGLPPGRAWASAAISGMLLFVGCHGALAYAQQYVPSGLSAVMLATVPLWIVLLNAFAPTDPRAKMLTFAGLLPGLAGVALIAWPQDRPETATIDPLMLLLLLGSAFFWAAGSLLSRRQQAFTSAIALSSMQLLCGGAALLIGSGLAGELSRFSAHDVTASSWAGLSYLIGAGSVVAFTAYMWLLDHEPAPLVGTYTFVNPIIAVILGWKFLGERPNPQMLVGTVLIVGSVAAVWSLRSRASPRARSAIADQA